MHVSTDSRPPSLWIGSPETEIEANPAGTTTVGRMGDLVVGGDNAHMHRRLVTITAEGKVWRLANVGRFIPVHVTQLDGVLLTTLAPGASTVIEWPEFLLTFSAGQETYHLDCYAEIPLSREASLHTLHGDETIGLGPLSEDERLILAAIGEDVLRSPTHDYSLMRKNTEVAERLGWTRKKFDHRLDDVCAHFAAHGVGGASGPMGPRQGNASNRRIKVLQHAIEARLITVADLALVEAEAAAD